MFGSPCRLNLRLQYGTARKSSRKTLNIWSSLPILLWPDDNLPWNMDHIMAALKHNDRVCEINLWDISSSQLGKALAAMQEPFPALTSLVLRPIVKKAQVIPDSFLGGSAPRLRDLTLYDIAFPGLPKLLPSAIHLVRLDLFGIPRSGYISPQAMVTCLSTLTRLERLCLIFDSPQSRPHRESRRPHPLTRSVLPALTDFVFSGVREYLDDFVTRIDAPMLHILSITCSARECAGEFVAETRSTELERKRDVSVETFARRLPQHGSSKRGARLVERSRRRGRERRAS